MITVIAGVNGAGKSSLIGSFLRQAGGDYFNPDEVARTLMIKDSSLTDEGANALAWQMGYEELVLSIDEGFDHTFETTLGGDSICELLHTAMDKGQEVRILFCGLASPELHIQRVAERVARGGHHIPEAKIRQRWSSAIHNMLSLIPRCAAVRVYDNSVPAGAAEIPAPIVLFSLAGNQFVEQPVADMPEWAKPLAVAAMKRVLENGYPNA